MTIKSALTYFGSVLLSSYSSKSLNGFVLDSVLKNSISGIVCQNFEQLSQFDQTSCRLIPAGNQFSLCPGRIEWLKTLAPHFRWIGKSTNDLTSTVSHWLGFQKGSIPFLFLTAAGEELLCRGLFQKGLQHLTGNPDSTAHKMIRIAASSLFFGLLHTDFWDCSAGGTFPQIAGGMIFGALAETHGLFAATLSHAIANYLI